MDATAQITHVSRLLERRDHGDFAVTLTTPLKASPGRVWDALTSPEHTAQWLGALSGDLREGGRYTLAGSGVEGTIERCAPETTLRVTWEDGGEPSLIEVALQPEDGATTITLTHTVPSNEHWAKYGPAATGIGWDGALLALALFLAGDPQSAPASMERFLATEEGVTFVTAVGSSWRDAHVASGADREAAEGAARETVAFYTGA